jgi:hypothetical protein
MATRSLTTIASSGGELFDGRPSSTTLGFR